MMNLIKTNGKNQDFIHLVQLLDEDLNMRYGEVQKQYKTHNILDDINDVIIAFCGDIPVACGAFKEHDTDTIELKRIFVKAEFRRQGISKLIVNELEHLGKSKGYSHAVLETGKKQQEAIHLYHSLGYTDIQNFAPYIGNQNSICMKKAL